MAKKMGISVLLISCLYIGGWSFAVGPANRPASNGWTASLATVGSRNSTQTGFDAQSTDLSDGVQKIFLSRKGGGQLTWKEVVALWVEDEDFRSFFSQQLAASPRRGFFWECPAVTASGVAAGQPFEFVLVPAAGFADASPEMFQAQLDQCQEQYSAVAFANLGGDSTLVSPCKPRDSGAASGYGHLAQFSRSAPAAAQQALWAMVGATLNKHLSEGGREIWLNTEGSGVPWVHIRLDDRPKYYHYDPYVDAR